MRALWVATILLILVSIGLLIIIIGQRQVLAELQQTFERGKLLSTRLAQVHTNRAIFKATMAKLVAEGTKAAEELEAELAALKTEEATSKAEYEACQAGKMKMAEEMANLERKHIESEDAFKAESDAWTREINSLKEMLTERRPICNYVKRDPLVLKICGIESAELLPKMKQEQNTNHNDIPLQSTASQS